MEEYVISIDNLNDTNIEQQTSQPRDAKNWWDTVVIRPNDLLDENRIADDAATTKVTQASDAMMLKFHEQRRAAQQNPAQAAVVTLPAVRLPTSQPIDAKNWWNSVGIRPNDLPDETRIADDAATTKVTQASEAMMLKFNEQRRDAQQKNNDQKHKQAVAALQAKRQRDTRLSDKCNAILKLEEMEEIHNILYESKLSRDDYKRILRYIGDIICAGLSKEYTIQQLNLYVITAGDTPNSQRVCQLLMIKKGEVYTVLDNTRYASFTDGDETESKHFLHSPFTQIESELKKCSLEPQEYDAIIHCILQHMCSGLCKRVQNFTGIELDLAISSPDATTYTAIFKIDKTIDSTNNVIWLPALAYWDPIKHATTEFPRLRAHPGPQPRLPSGYEQELVRQTGPSREETQSPRGWKHANPEKHNTMGWEPPRPKGPAAPVPQQNGQPPPRNLRELSPDLKKPTKHPPPKIDSTPAPADREVTPPSTRANFIEKQGFDDGTTISKLRSKHPLIKPLYATTDTTGAPMIAKSPLLQAPLPPVYPHADNPSYADVVASQRQQPPPVSPIDDAGLHIAQHGSDTRSYTESTEVPPDINGKVRRAVNRTRTKQRKSAKNQNDTIEDAIDEQKKEEKTRVASVNSLCLIIQKCAIHCDVLFEECNRNGSKDHRTQLREKFMEQDGWKIIERNGDDPALKYEREHHGSNILNDAIAVTEKALNARRTIIESIYLRTQYLLKGYIPIFKNLYTIPLVTNWIDIEGKYKEPDEDRRIMKINLEALMDSYDDNVIADPEVFKALACFRYDDQLF